MQERGIKIPRLSVELDIPKDRIYKWFQEGTNPKVEDADKLNKWINGENLGEIRKENFSKIVIEYANHNGYKPITQVEVYRFIKGADQFTGIALCISRKSL